MTDSNNSKDIKPAEGSKKQQTKLKNFVQESIKKISTRNYEMVICGRYLRIILEAKNWKFQSKLSPALDRA